MTTGAKNAARAGQAPRSDRDRFVAFAFCWADLLIEIDEDRNVVFAAGPTEALLGALPAALKERPLLSLFNPRDATMVTALLDIAVKQGRFDRTKVRLLGPGGPTQPLEMAGYQFADMKRHFYLALRLIAPARRRGPGGQPLKRDASSGLYDADSFTAIVGDSLAGAGDDGGLTLIALNGLDDLRGRMDAESQESFMTALGTSLRASSIGGDTAAQLADDRYVVLHDGNVAAQDLRQQIAGLARSADPTGAGIKVEAATIAAGDAGLSDDELASGLIFAINRFRSAKGSGFNLHSLTSSLSSLMSEAVTSVQKFRNILSSGDFEVAFQPIIDVTTGEIHHYEALCRFRSTPDGESPFGYITFAEETGLIPEFDLAMAGKVIEWLHLRTRDGKAAAAVNVSGNSVTSLHYVVGLHSLLKENAGLKNRLIFEITESARMDDLDAADRFIQGLRSQGYEVCLDDFGAGAANFQYLSTLDVDVVKLDGSAVRNAQRAAKGEAFLKALVSLCRDLGVKTIAEMVDDKKGLNFIRRCGVDYVQGYLFGKPSTDIRDFAGNRPDDLFPGRRRR